MLVSEILNTETPYLSTSDNAGKAAEKFKAARCRKLVVVDENGVLAGKLAKKDLAELSEKDKSIATLKPRPVITVLAGAHVYEAARLIFAYDIENLPVVDGAGKYMGTVHKTEVMDALSLIFNLITAGSVIELELEERDYTLADIVRLVETEGGKILNIAVQQPDAERKTCRVSLKLNLEDTSAVSAALRRFGYEIISEESSTLLEYDFSERADELIRYLDI